MNRLPPGAGKRVNVEDLVVGNQYYIINDFSRKINHIRIISKKPIFVPGYPQGTATFRIVIESINPNKPYPDSYMTITNLVYEPEKFYDVTEYFNLMDSINKQPSKKLKDIAMGELTGSPGGIDYEEAKARFGKGLKTRKRRHRLKRTMKRKNGRHLIRTV
jgi:hypothetical protein